MKGKNGSGGGIKSTHQKEQTVKEVDFTAKLLNKKNQLTKPKQAPELGESESEGFAGEIPGLEQVASSKGQHLVPAQWLESGSDEGSMNVPGVETRGQSVVCDASGLRHLGSLQGR